MFFKANLIFKDFSRQLCVFKYYSNLCEHCLCHVEYFYVLHSFLIFIMLTCITVVGMYFHSEWKAEWILISWVHKKPDDLDLQCFQKIIDLGSARQGFMNPVPRLHLYKNLSRRVRE